MSERSRISTLRWIWAGTVALSFFFNITEMRAFASEFARDAGQTLEYTLFSIPGIIKDVLDGMYFINRS